MAVIDIGPGATDRASNTVIANRTYIDINNPANDTGVLDTFEVWSNIGMNGFKIGTFSGSSTSYTSRDVETLGTIDYGSKQTFTGKSCDVTSGDFIGCYMYTGQIERTTSGFAGVYNAEGDLFGTGTKTYAPLSGDALSLYATGATAAVGNPYYYYLNQ